MITPFKTQKTNNCAETNVTFSKFPQTTPNKNKKTTQEQIQNKHKIQNEAGHGNPHITRYGRIIKPVNRLGY